MSSQQILSSGIFASEPGQRLLTICDTLTRRAFHGLYVKCKDNVDGNYYQTGLRRVHVWSDDIVSEDIQFVRGTCPDIDETYEMCFVHYVEERFRGNKRPTVHCPTLLKFVRRFLESVALHEHMQTAEFFTTRDVIQKRITCMDACRTAFYSLVNADSVRVEMESVVSRGGPPSEVSRTKQRKRDEAQEPPPEVVLDAEEPEIHPNDSISQINVAPSVASQTVDHPPPPPSTPRHHPVPRKAPSPPPREEHEEEEEGEEEEKPHHRGAASSAHQPPPPPSSYISTASSTSRRRVDDTRDERRRADENVGRHYHSVEPDACSETSRHDFEMVDSGSVASLRTRSAVGSRDSSVSIGMKRMKSPRSR